uniref:Uncharacterized protein n=1 Tax=Oryza sativa subsp. indica TaxID=39946 RepID=A0A679B8U8_ORYSI|nr:hypothetical protein [Oryza sativa Indica Group]BBD82431.1 hypothetical protein [Oryza sativa Indica Group]
MTKTSSRAFSLQVRPNVTDSLQPVSRILKMEGLCPTSVPSEAVAAAAIRPAIQVQQQGNAGGAGEDKVWRRREREKRERRRRGRGTSPQWKRNTAAVARKRNTAAAAKIIQLR